MKKSQVQDLSQIAGRFFGQNYDYLWLKTMLEKASHVKLSGSTLITGSSHALNGIWEQAWINAINCSMHSQDIYYDFLCAKNALSSSKDGHPFSRCFIIMGYYIAFQDLSLSKVSRETMITNIYYPIFQDGHNWNEACGHDPWAEFEGLTKSEKKRCEDAVEQKILELGTYYSGN